MTVLILASREDEHARHMQAHLCRRGANAELLDSRLFPAACGLSFDPCTGNGLLRLEHGCRLTWRDIRAVYWRNYEMPAMPPLEDPEQAWIAANDTRALLESFLIHLPALWVNSFHAWQLHQTKPVQLARVAGLGIPTPATRITNEPEEVLKFTAVHPRCIFKPVQGGAMTQRVTARHLRPENLAGLAYAPLTLQEEVPGVDIRVFVAGERIVACQIETESLDFRDDPQPQLTAIPVSPELEDWSLKIAAALDLRWTGMDWRRTPDGRHVFLEANPSPMFLGFEQSTGLPLTRLLGDLLAGNTDR
jgi:glutathione synthase/RimK-type ligase-like ATP-grasp enzyme